MLGLAPADDVVLGLAPAWYDIKHGAGVYPGNWSMHMLGLAPAILGESPVQPYHCLRFASAVLKPRSSQPLTFIRKSGL